MVDGDAACNGTCLCGAVRFSFTGPPKFVVDCVCESCRRAHGATAVAWVGVEAERFRIDAGETLLRWYPSSAEAERGFCPECGTRLLFRSSRWPGEVHMALACIAPPHDLRSTGVVFRTELPVWTALSLAPAGSAPAAASAPADPDAPPGAQTST